MNIPFGNNDDDHDVNILLQRAKRAEDMLDKVSKEVGVWSTARDVVEERLARLRYHISLLIFFF